MKTLVNKRNPAIRITAPEIIIENPPIGNEGYVYWIPAINEICNPIDWILVEEEPEVDLEKEIDKTISECTNGYNFDWDRFARHFYELGLKARKGE